MVYSLVKMDFSNMRNLIQNETPVSNINYKKAVKKLIALSSEKGFRAGFSMSTLEDILEQCEDKNFKLDMLKRVEDIVLAEIEGDEMTFCEVSALTNVYCFFGQDIFDMTGNWDFWPTPLGNTQLCEQLLLPYLDDEAFLDIGSKREWAAYSAIKALLMEKSIVAYQYLRNLLLSDKASKLVPPYKSYWEFRLKGFYEDIGGERLYRETLFYVGNAWEEVCYNILLQSGVELIRHPRLPNNSIPDIAVGTVQTNDNGEITYADLIIECKKSVYFGVLDNEPTNNYTPYCNRLEFWVLEKANNPYFTYPDTPKLHYYFGCDVLASPHVSEANKAQIRRLLQMSKDAINIHPYDDIKAKDICHMIDSYLAIPPEIRQRFLEPKQKKKERVQRYYIRQYKKDGTFINQFDSIKDAVDATIGVTSNTISNVINGRRSSAGGFLWRRCDIDSPIENIVPPNTSFTVKGKLIYQVTQEGEVIGIFETIGKAEKVSGVNRRSISDALKGVQRTAGGYVWLFGDATNQ